MFKYQRHCRIRQTDASSKTRKTLENDGQNGEIFKLAERRGKEKVYPLGSGHSSPDAGLEGVAVKSKLSETDEPSQRRKGRSIENLPARWGSQRGDPKNLILSVKGVPT